MGRTRGDFPRGGTCVVVFGQSLPYYPANADKKALEEKNFWDKAATVVALAELKSLNIVRPNVMSAYDANDFMVVDLNLAKDDAAKVDATRKKLHNMKFKQNEHEVNAFDAQLRKSTAEANATLISAATMNIWVKIVKSLGENFRFVQSLPNLGDVAALLAEINTAMHADLAQDKMAIRKQLSLATFENEGDCQLNKWKFYVNHKAQRLKGLGAPYSEEEIVSIFLEGLPAIPFGTFRQQVFNSKDTFLQIADRARAYAAGTDSRLQLEQLYNSKHRSGERAAPQIFALNPAVAAAGGKLCYDFARGSCTRPHCRFSHVAPLKPGPTDALPTSSHCNRYGHSVDACFVLHGYPQGQRGGKGFSGGNRGKGDTSRGAGRGRGAQAAQQRGNMKTYMLNTADSSNIHDRLDALEARLTARLREAEQQDTEQLHMQHNYMLKVVPLYGVPSSAGHDEQVISRPVVQFAFPNVITATTIGVFPGAGIYPDKQDVADSVVLNLGNKIPTGVDKGILLDGGATIHATNRLEACFDIKPCGVTVGGVGGEFVCRTMGSLIIATAEGILVRLHDVYMSDKFPLTFVSESKLLNKGCSILKHGSSGTVRDANNSLVFTITPREGLFMIDGAVQLPPAPKIEVERMLLARAYSKPETSLDRLGVLHRRMQHASFHKVAESYGLKLPVGFTPPFCEPCVMAKSANHPHHEGARADASVRFQGLHCDFCGPFPCDSLSGARYLLVFIDSFTGFIWDFYPNSQTEFFDIWHALLARLDNEARQSVLDTQRQCEGIFGSSSSQRVF